MQFTTAARVSALILSAAFIYGGVSQQAYGVAARHHGRRHAHQKTIVQVAQANGYHTFDKAVAAAGLTGTLEHGGPYTVFAPTDEAFTKLGKKELDDLMGDKKSLSKVLLHHVVKGKYDAAAMQKPQELKALDGSALVVTYKDKVEVGGALVTAPDMKASNGLIHGVDEVILPNTVR